MQKFDHPPTSPPASQNLGRPTRSVNRMPATAAMAQRPLVSSASRNHFRVSASVPRRRGSKLQAGGTSEALLSAKIRVQTMGVHPTK